MTKNTGTGFEDKVYTIIEELVTQGNFLLSNPHVRIQKKPQYYSGDREDMISFDISVEKYLADPDHNKELRPSIIVIVECKDYKGKISVDEIEEFHSKLQQIGADNTKGIMITSTGVFQRSAIKYASAKGIALARILPEDQVEYILYKKMPIFFSNVSGPAADKAKALCALTQEEYISKEGNNFFTLTGETSLREIVSGLLSQELS